MGIGPRLKVEAGMRTSLIVNVDDWIEFDRIAKRLKTDRATLLRNYIEHTLGKAELPKIPAAA
jgi:hypothetical protein